MTTFRLRALALFLVVSAAAQAQPVLSGTVTPTGIVNGPYSSGLSASGGLGTYTWDISGGALPGGLAIDPVTGVISGITTTGGNHNFRVRVTDQNLSSATSDQSVFIYPALSITTLSLPPTTAGATYSQALGMSGGNAPFTWSIAGGALPAGININPGSGLLSGSASAAGSYTFTAQVACCTTGAAPQQLTILVNPPLNISGGPFPDVAPGGSFSQSVSATGGTGAHTWSISAGSLPPGVTLDTSTGAIAGNPTTPGLYSFTVRATDTVLATATRDLTIYVVLQPTVTTTSFAPVTVGQSVSNTLTLTSGTAPFTWSVSGGALPAGITLTPGTGGLSGTPTTAGPASFTVHVTDVNSQSASQTLNWTVNPRPSISTTLLPQTTVGASYSVTMAGSGGTGALAWSITTGTLPDGLTLNAATGVISGIATAAVSSGLVVSLTDSNSVAGTQGLGLIVNAAPVVSTTTLPRGVTSDSYSQTLSATGGTGALTWTLTAGSLPPGLSLTAGSITGTPTAIGTFNFTVRATDTMNIGGNQALSILVIDHPDITTTTLSAITVGQPVAVTAAAIAGNPGYTWSISSGNLPAGITLNSGTGALTGSPTTAGTAGFNLRVIDSNSLDDIQALSWVVNPAPSITTTTLPPTSVGGAYSQTLVGAGGTGTSTWSVTAGNLPGGLTLNSASGLLSGTAGAAGTFNFTVSLTDANSIVGSQPLTILVNVAPTVLTSAFPQAVTTLPYSQTLTSTGGTGAHTWSIVGGALPAGLSLNASTGAITGAATSVGTVNFTVQVMDSVNVPGTRPLSIEVINRPDILTTSFPAITLGQAVATAVTAHLGTTPYVWSIDSGALPAGITLNPATGALAGIPTTGGTSSFTVKVTDANSLTDARAFTWAVNGGLIINTSSLPPTTIGAPYSQTLVGAGGTGTLTWGISSGTLPAGLNLNTSTGAITGLSTASGTANFVVSLTDTNQIAGSQPLSIVVNVAPSVTTSTLPRGVVGTAYSQTLSTTGGTGAIAWSILSGTLPAGLTLNPSGTITGTPTTLGTASFTLQVADTQSITGSRALTIEVVNHPVITTSSVLAPAEQAAPIARALVATSGTPPYTWTITSGALPLDTTLTSAGVLTGGPAITGTYSFTVTVSDAYQLEDHRAFTWLIVAPPPSVPGGALPPAYRNSPYFAPLLSAGGVSPRSWSLVSGTLPPGISVAVDGSVNGTGTTNGLYTFTLRLVDGTETAATGTFTLEVRDRPQFRVSPESLSFSGKVGAGPTAPLQVEISSIPAPADFTILTDQDWLHVSQNRSGTPAVINVTADPAGRAAGKYFGLISIAGAESRSIPVTFTVEPAPTVDPAAGGVDVAPAQINITTSRQGGVERRLIVAHSDIVTGTVSVRSSVPWITASSPLLSNEGRDAAITVTVDPSGLDNGSYDGALFIARGPSLEKRVAVQLSVANSTFDVSQSGLTFDAVAGSARTPAQQLFISTRGAAPLSWQASVSADAPWIRLGYPLGTANPTSMLGVQINTTSLTTGVYSGVVTVASQPGGASRPVDVRLNLVAGSIRPQVAPHGLAFTATAAEPANSQQILLSNPQAVGTSYVSHLSPDSASSWLTVGAASGNIPAGGAATLIAQTQTSPLAPGIYNADLTIEFADQTVEVVHLTLTVAGDSCVPSRLVPVLTKPGDHFQIRAGWPTSVEVLVTDDCGQQISAGSALMRFSDVNEPAVSLIPAPGGRWTATWTPLGGHTSITADILLQDVTRTKSGAVTITGGVGPSGLPATQQ